MKCAHIFLLAFLLDALVGDPVFRLHPVRLIGALIAKTEKLLRNAGLTGKTGGLLLTLVVLALSLAVYLAPRLGASFPHPFAAFALDVAVVYFCIAPRDLIVHARAVAVHLDSGNLDQARIAVQKIVGRDAASLDPSGVARAAVETVSENFVDGFFAPLFWYAAVCSAAYPAGNDPAVFGVSAILAYRIINTLDSMVGYKNRKYRDFGRFAARLDDAVNFIPARIAPAVLFPAAVLCGLDAAAGWKIAIRDRLKHTSPNSGHAESFAAGCLGLRLGGPSQYPHGLVEKPWLGDGATDASASHILAACRLATCAGWISVMAPFILVVSAASILPAY